jgi:hypothetical protein
MCVGGKICMSTEGGVVQGSKGRFSNKKFFHFMNVPRFNLATGKLLLLFLKGHFDPLTI